MTYKPPLTGPFGQPLIPAATNFHSTGDQAAGDELIQANVGNINRFIASQRRAVNGGIVQIQKSRASFDGLDVFYQNQFGKETINYVAHPNPPPPIEAPEIPEIPEIEVNVVDMVLYTLAVEFGDGAGAP